MTEKYCVMIGGAIGVGGSPVTQERVAELLNEHERLVNAIDHKYLAESRYQAALRQINICPMIEGEIEVPKWTFDQHGDYEQ